MNIRWLILFLAAAGQCVLAADRWVPYQLLTEDELKLPKLSMIGRQVLKHPDDYLIGQSEHFIVFAETRPQLQNAIDDAENALKRAGKWFNLDIEGIPTSLLVFVRDGKAWDKLMKGYGLRRDSLAMQIGKELYFKDVPQEKIKPERVSHEVIQLSLNLSFSPRVPLWLDEGIASYFGWICAVEMYNKREIAIRRTMPRIDPGYLLEFEDLLATRKYPRSPEKARAFYRQAEELIAVLVQRLDSSDFARFVHTLCAGDGSSVTAFREAAGLADGEMDDIVRQVRQKCME